MRCREMKAISILAGALALAGCSTASARPSDLTVAAAPPVDQSNAEGATRILDQAMAERLLGNGGMTLQWISWEDRGVANVTIDADGLWHLSARQAQAGMGSVTVNGIITEIGADYFTFEGEITIADAPDAGRRCSEDKPWHFGITQNRAYWRLREFEWCDGLTDYIDIYF